MFYIVSEIEVMKLARVVFSKVHEVCAEWERALPNIQLPNRTMEVSVHAIKNTRRKMEDRHVTLPYINYMFNTQVSQPLPLTFFTLTFLYLYLDPP